MCVCDVCLCVYHLIWCLIDSSIPEGNEKLNINLAISDFLLIILSLMKSQLVFSNLRLSKTKDCVIKMSNKVHFFVVFGYMSFLIRDYWLKFSITSHEQFTRDRFCRYVAACWTVLSSRCSFCWCCRHRACCCWCCWRCYVVVAVVILVAVVVLLLF